MYGEWIFHAPFFMPCLRPKPEVECVMSYINDAYVTTYVSKEHKGWVESVTVDKARPKGKDGKYKTDLQLEMYARNKLYVERTGDKKHFVKRRDYKILKALRSNVNAESAETHCPCGMRNIETAKGKTYSKMR